MLSQDLHRSALLGPSGLKLTCRVNAPPQLHRAFAHNENLQAEVSSAEESKLDTSFEMLYLNRASCFWEDGV